MISVQKISHSYDADFLIHFKDWNIKQRENWLLLGNSGSGKTTLLHIITGLLKPTKGNVFIEDTNLYQLNDKQRDQFRGQKIGLVFQQPHLIKSLNIEENIAVAQTFSGLPYNIDRIKQVLDDLQLLEKRKSKPNELSQGQLQRVALARAIINKPALLVADEPTSSLDDKNTAIVLDILISQSKLNNSTLIIATHDKRVKDNFSNHYIL